VVEKSKKNLLKASKSSKNISAKPKSFDTMEQILSSYGSVLRVPKIGEKVLGRIVAKEPGRVYIDFGGKYEGLVAQKSYKEAEEFLKSLDVGDEVFAKVLVPETRDGFTILSLRDAVEEASWKKVEEIYKKGETIYVLVRGVSSRGLIVDYMGLSGFLPLSQLSKKLSQNFQTLLGQKLQVKILDYDKEGRRLFLSEKEVSEKEELERQRKVLKLVEEGEVLEGIVVGIYDFGCLVSVEKEVKDMKSKGKSEKVFLEGLVHISELSWDKVKNVQDVVSEGQKVKMVVIGKKGDKLALSIKRVEKDPWEDIDKRYKLDTRIKGRVSSVHDYGVFVSLEPGIEGLLHITKIPPEKKLSPGQEVDVFVENIDKEQKKISLGLVLKEKPIGYK